MRNRENHFGPAWVPVAAVLLIALPAHSQSDPVARASAYVNQSTGLPLDKLVESALAKNADLLAVRQRAAEAQGLLRQAGLRVNPGVDLSVSNGAILGSPGEREYSVGYAHTFELGGKRERRIDVASLGVELADLDIADRERQLKADVKVKFGEALAAERNLDAAQRLLELNRQSYGIAEARAKQGEAPALEPGLLRVELNRITSDRLLFANQVERAVLELKTLTGTDLKQPVQISGLLQVPTVALTLEQATTRALPQRPDLRAARLQENLADADLQLARTEAVPNLVASGRYSHVTSRFDQYGFTAPGGPLSQIHDRDNLLTAGISIILPTRNRNQGNIQAAVARKEAAALRRRFQEQVVRREVEAAFTRYETATQALRVFDQGVIQQSEENVRILRTAYEVGELRLLDVINEQRRLIDTQRAFTDLLREAYTAAVELERAVGGPVF